MAVETGSVVCVDKRWWKGPASK